MSAPATDPPPSAEPQAGQAGDRLGAYTLVEPLGEGGFGSVWIAEQQQPVRRRVALKLIKAGMASREVLVRFEAERQALAVMDHPGIAKVLDAGTAASGQPFFVMELVDGQPLTSYADEARLDLRGRLQLFRDVCLAIQHAHQKGIVHRDLKPANVMVAEDGGRPVPRVIDFGIAKALQSPLTESTLQTGAHQIMGTPAYMAPEQAMASADVDTRADVYSLGALLYELLTGCQTFDLERGTTTLPELLRQIREVDPPLPSRRLTSLDGDRRDDVAASRDTTLQRLSRELRGDLDWIVRRALEKDREQRYAGVAELAADVERYLAHEPVSAGPPSRLYRLRKLVRRHRGAAAGLGLALLSLVGGLVLLVWSNARIASERDAADQARREEALARTDAESARDLADRAREQEAEARLEAERSAHEARAARDLAEQRRRDAEQALEASRVVTRFLEELLASARPDELGRAVTVRQVLDLAAPILGPRFGERPQVEASLRGTLGAAYRSLGELGPAREQLERAVALNVELHGQDHPEALTARQQLVLLDWMDGDLAGAQATIGAVHADLLAQLGADHPQRLEALNVVGILHHAQGDDVGAERAWREVLTRRETLLGEQHPDTLQSRKNLGSAVSGQGRWDEGEALLRAALAGFSERLGPRHPETLSCLNDLGTSLYDQGAYLDAVPLMEQLLAARRELLGVQHPLTLGSLSNLGSAYWQLGRLQEALALAMESYQEAAAGLGEDSAQALRSANLLGNLLVDLEQFDEGERWTRRAFEGRQQLLGSDHPDTLTSLQNLGALARDRGQLVQAGELFEQLVERRVRALGPDHERTLRAHWLVASVARERGLTVRAEELLRDLLPRAVARLGPESPWTVDVEAELAWTLLDLGRYDEAEELLQTVHARRSESLGRQHPLTVNALEGLARLYRDSGRPAELEAMVRSLFLLTKERAEGPDSVPADQNMLAWYYSAGPVEDLHDPLLALQWSERANQATGYGVPRYLDVLSDARRLNGDLQGALDAHLRALEVMVTDDPMRGYHEEVAADLRRALEQR